MAFDVPACQLDVADEVLNNTKMSSILQRVDTAVVVGLSADIIPQNIRHIIVHQLSPATAVSDMIECLNKSTERNKIDMFIEALIANGQNLIAKDIQNIYHGVLREHEKSNCTVCHLPDVPKEDIIITKEDRAESSQQQLKKRSAVKLSVSNDSTKEEAKNSCPGNTKSKESKVSENLLKEVNEADITDSAQQDASKEKTEAAKITKPKKLSKKPVTFHQIKTEFPNRTLTTTFLERALFLLSGIFVACLAAWIYTYFK